MKTFKVLSALLSYPTRGLIEAAPEFPAILDAERVVPAACRGPLDLLIEEIAVGEVYDLQERYVLLFDRSRTLSLNLFEHIHGESRDRGGAMVDLLETYRAGGFDVPRRVADDDDGRPRITELGAALLGASREELRAVLDGQVPSCFGRGATPSTSGRAAVIDEREPARR